MGLGLRTKVRDRLKMGLRMGVDQDVLDDRIVEQSGGGPPPAPTLVSIAVSPSPGVQYET